MYNDRLTSVLDLFAKAKVPVIWLGQPVARETNYANDMSYLNGLYEAATKTAGVDYLPLWTVIADENGNYLPYGKALDGETKRLRLDDGIHFTPAGYDIVAVKVREQIDALLAKPADTVAPTDAAPAPADPAPAEKKPAQAKPMPTETAAAPVDKADAPAPSAPSDNPAPAAATPTPSAADSSAHS
jgi:hypothetical protein